MTKRSTGPACGNNPNHQLSEGDRQAVDMFSAYLAARTELRVASHRLAQVRDAARLHRHQLIGTSELYAVIEAEPATVQPPADRAAILRELADQQEQTAATDVIRKRRSIATARRLFAVELRRLAAEAHDTGTQQPEPDDTDLTEADIDRMMAAGVPVQIVTRPPDTHGANESSTRHDTATAAGQNLRFAPQQPTDEDVVEAHRLALSEALHLGNAAPWDAILDRAADLNRRDVETLRRLAAEAPPAPTTDQLAAAIEQAVYEHRELTCQWDETDGTTQAITRRVTAALLDVLGARRPANEAQQPQPDARPARGDQFEQWLKTQRDDWSPKSPPWNVLDDALDLYRLHADTGTPLSEHVCEGRAIGDCECLEPAPGTQQPPAADTDKEV